MAEQDQKLVVCRGFVTTATEDALSTQHALRRAFLERLPFRRVIDDLSIQQTDIRLEEQNRRPFYRRITIVPSEQMTSLSHWSCCTIPDWFLRLVMWITAIAIALKIVSMQPGIRDQVREGTLIGHLLGISFPSLLFLPSLRFGALSVSVLKTFEFWYLSLQLIAATIIETIAASDIIPNNNLNIGLHVLFLIGNIIGFLCIDALGWTPGLRAARQLLFAALSVISIVDWAAVNERRQTEIDVLLFETTYGGLAQGFYLTLLAFMCKNAVGALTGNPSPMRTLPPGVVLGLIDQTEEIDPSVDK